MLLIRFGFLERIFTSIVILLKEYRLKFWEYLFMFLFLYVLGYFIISFFIGL